MTWVRAFLVLVLVLLVQSTVGFDLRIAGAHPELVWLLPIAAAFVAGPQRGALVGFVAGVAYDLFLPTPFGLTALVGCLLGFAVGRLAGSAEEPDWWAAPLTALVGTAVAVMLYAVLGAVLGQDQMLKVNLAAVLAVPAVVNAVLVLPVLWLVRWAKGSTRRRALATRSRW